ncbi:MAG: MBL fold metallo-hydrolase [Alphaproteobacteria bacterium]
MKPLVQAQLVNGEFGDPGLYLDFLFESRALLFDLGDLSPLPPRKLLRLSHIFVSHTHMDHFCGFDRILRTLLGRETRLHLLGPPGFADRIGHKLAAYTWNLAPTFEADLVFDVTELAGDQTEKSVFRCKSGFTRESGFKTRARDGVVLREDGFEVRAVTLDHDIPCLAFALHEHRHVNILKDRLAALGLPVGPWLHDLKKAVLRGDPDEALVRVAWREGESVRETHVALGQMKDEVLRVVPGQKIAYVTDVRYHDENARRIIELARDADTLFIETPFLEEDAAIAARKNHLTAAQAGRIAREAHVKKLVPFHFSPRYQGREEELRREAESAFLG